MSAPGGHDRETGEDEGEAQLDGYERWVLPYLEESTLWPVLIVLLATIVAFGSVVILFAVRDLMPVSIISLGMLVVVSVRVIRYDWRRSGRPAALSAVVAITWAFSLVAAYYGDRWSLL